MFLGDFCKLNQTPSDGNCLGEPPGFCDVGCCYCSLSLLFDVFLMLVVAVVVLHSLLFKIIFHSSVSYLQVFTPILYFQPSPSLRDLRHFHFNLSGPFCYSFTVSATILSRCFLPKGVFLPYTPSQHFWHNCFYQALPGSRQFYFEVC